MTSSGIRILMGMTRPCVRSQGEMGRTWRSGIGLRREGTWMIGVSRVRGASAGPVPDKGGPLRGWIRRKPLTG